MSVSLSLRNARALCTTTIASTSHHQQHIFARLKQERDPEKIVLLFESNTDNRVLLENRFAYQDAVSRLAGAGRPDLIERLLEGQAAIARCRRRTAFLSRLILLYGLARMPDHAVRAFHRIPFPPPTPAFNAVLTALSRCRCYDDLRRFFVEDARLSPDVYSYNILLHAVCELRDFDSALLLLIQLENCAKIVSDVISYTTLIAANYRNGRGKLADCIWNRMVMKGVRPNVTTFNVRIEYLINRRKHLQARNMMRKMVSMGIKPDHMTYNLVIKGFCVVGSLKMAKEFFFGMKESDLEPNSRIYQTMIHYLVAGGDFGLAFELCKESMLRNWFPNVDTVKKLLCGLTKDIENHQKVIEMVELVGKRVPSYPLKNMNTFRAFLPKDAAE